MPSEKKATSKAFTKAFSQVLLRHLSLAGPTTSDGQIFMGAFKSVDPALLTAFVASASVEERHALLSSVPIDALRHAVAGLPAGIFSPVTPLPASFPVNGVPGTILETTYVNMEYDTSDPNWASNICDGRTLGLTSPPKWEWMSVYDPSVELEGSLSNPIVGLTGWVSGDFNQTKIDVPWVHPFGMDWEGYIAPDPRYENLLAPTNLAVSSNPNLTSHPEYVEATQHAQDVLGLSETRGVMGVEIDQGLVPMNFRQQFVDGARVAVFGRWIVDGGHADFHSEIHPPVLMAVATPIAGPPGGSDITSVQVMSRPFSVSQKFAIPFLGDKNWVDKLVSEVAQAETVVGTLPNTFRVALHPTLLTPPYEGATLIKLLVRPPVPRPTPVDRLTVSFHFTHRQGVAVRVFDAGNDAVGVIIVLGRTNPVELPTPQDWRVSLTALHTLDPDHADIYDAVIGVDALLDQIAAAILARGIFTDLYDPPSATSSLDYENVVSAIPIDQLDPAAGVSEDDQQVFPIYGTINVGWQRQIPPILSRPPADPTSERLS